MAPAAREIFLKWRSKLKAARKRYEGEVRKIELDYLPLVVLGLNRHQLTFVYERLFKKPKPSRAADAIARAHALHARKVCGDKLRFEH